MARASDWVEGGHRPGREDDPFRLEEWKTIPDVCLIEGCTDGRADQRGPVFVDGRMFKACPPHWEGIMLVLGEQNEMVRILAEQKPPSPATAMHPAYWFPMTCAADWCPAQGKPFHVELEFHASGLLKHPRDLRCPGCGCEPIRGALHLGDRPVQENYEQLASGLPVPSTTKEN